MLPSHKIGISEAAKDSRWGKLRYIEAAVVFGLASQLSFLSHEGNNNDTQRRIDSPCMLVYLLIRMLSSYLGCSGRSLLVEHERRRKNGSKEDEPHVDHVRSQRRDSQNLTRFSQAGSHLMYILW